MRSRCIWSPQALHLYIKSYLETSFLLIPRGECPFVTKAIHAQELGAKVAIIMDN